MILKAPRSESPSPKLEPSKHFAGIPEIFLILVGFMWSLPGWPDIMASLSFSKFLHGALCYPTTIISGNHWANSGDTKLALRPLFPAVPSRSTARQPETVVGTARRLGKVYSFVSHDTLQKLQHVRQVARLCLSHRYAPVISN